MDSEKSEYELLREKNLKEQEALVIYYFRYIFYKLHDKSIFCLV